MNELLFFSHILIVVFFVFGALRLGKEALACLTALYAVLANFFVLKQIFLFGWNVTCSDVFAVGSILSLNLLQEYWGRETAKKTVWISFFSMAAFGALSQIHLFYTPSSFDVSQPHFRALLSFTPRLLSASLVSFLIVQQIDLRFYGFLKKRWPAASLPWRNSFSLFFTQVLDTVLFSFLGLYGIIASIGSIIILSFCVKLIIIACVGSLTALAKRFVRHEV